MKRNGMPKSKQTRKDKSDGELQSPIPTCLLFYETI